MTKSFFRQPVATAFIQIVYTLYSIYASFNNGKEGEKHRTTKIATYNSQARRNIIIIIKQFHRLSTTDILDMSPGEHERHSAIILCNFPRLKEMKSDARSSRVVATIFSIAIVI